MCHYITDVEDAFVEVLRRMERTDLKFDDLKDILGKFVNVVPRKKSPMTVEVILRSQGYDLMYRYIGQDEILGRREFGEMLLNGLKTFNNMVFLGGIHNSWRPNDIGIPVGVGLANPGMSRSKMGYGVIDDPEKQGISVKADVDVTMLVATYMAFYNPLGALQGVGKIRGSRFYFPVNAVVTLGPASKEFVIKMSTPTQENPSSFMFNSNTMVFISGQNLFNFMRDTCSDCVSPFLVTDGDQQTRRQPVISDNSHVRLGLESHVEIVNCENNKGQHSTSQMLFNALNSLEFYSRGSIPGWLLMSLMQVRNYYYYYPPTAPCSLKVVVHKANQKPADAVEIRLVIDRKASGGDFSGFSGSVAFVTFGEAQLKWTFHVTVEKEPSNLRSSISVSVFQLPSISTGIIGGALCANLLTVWPHLPADILQTPFSVEPSVQHEWSIVWGSSPTDQCPTAGAPGISSFYIQLIGNITQEQRDAAVTRDEYPYDQCDRDLVSAGRSGVTFPFTQVSGASTLYLNDLILMLIFVFLRRLVISLLCITQLLANL